MLKSRMIYLLILAVLPGQMRAYEIVAHGLITDHAYRISVLSDSSPESIYTVLGLDRLDRNYPFYFDNNLKGSNYRDEIPVTNPSSNLPVLGLGFTRIPQPEEAKVSRRLAARGLIPGDSGDNIHQKIRSWLIRGAVREDDNDVRVPYVGIWWKVGNRDLNRPGFLGDSVV